MTSVHNLTDKMPGARRYDPANPEHIYVGRANARYGLPASKWANPVPLLRERDRLRALGAYYRHLAAHPELRTAIPELRGKALFCWCTPKPCHGDILAALADASETAK